MCEWGARRASTGSKLEPRMLRNCMFDGMPHSGARTRNVSAPHPGTNWTFLCNRCPSFVLAAGCRSLALRGRLLIAVTCLSRPLAVAGCLLFAVACLGECEAIRYLFRNRDQIWVHIVDPVLGGAVELHGVLSPVRESKRTLLYLFQKTKHHQGKACTLSLEKCGTEILLKPTVCPPEPLRLLWL